MPADQVIVDPPRREADGAAEAPWRARGRDQRQGIAHRPRLAACRVARRGLRRGRHAVAERGLGRPDHIFAAGVGKKRVKAARRQDA